MKKKIAAGILALAMVAGMSTSAFAAKPIFVYEDESKGGNDTFSKANKFHLSNHVIIDGNASKGDLDYYEFSPSESGSFKFDFTPGNIDLSAGDAVVTLYDEKKNEIRSKKLNSSNTVVFTEELAESTNYYLKVENKRSKSYDYLIYIDKQN